MKWTGVIIFFIVIGNVSTSQVYINRNNVSKISESSYDYNQIITNTINKTQESLIYSQKVGTENSIPNTESTEQILTENEVPNEELIEEVVADSGSLFKERARTFSDGVSYLGQSYELGYFSGTGYVPTWTNTVYQWNDFPSHYLVEFNSWPGQTIFDLRLGSEVTISGVTYTVYDIIYNQANDQQGLDLVLYSGASASMQVCVSANDDSALNLYFLQKKN